MFCGHANNLLQYALARVSDANASAMDRLNTCFLALVICATATEGVHELAATVWLKAWRVDEEYWMEVFSRESNLVATHVREDAMKNTLFGQLVSRCATIDDASWSRVFLSGAVERHVVERLGDDTSLMVQRILRHVTPAHWHKGTS